MPVSIAMTQQFITPNVLEKQIGREMPMNLLDSIHAKWTMYPPLRMPPKGQIQMLKPHCTLNANEKPTIESLAKMKRFISVCVSINASQ